MHRLSVINTSQKYNLDNPDSTFDLASEDGHAHRLVTWRAGGAKDSLRIGETIQRRGEPEFPCGEIRYLDISRDVVFPMYAVTEYNAREWNIEVRYLGGRDSVIYPFQDKEQALAFQSMVTGYEVMASFENMAIYLTHRRHTSTLMNALRMRADPELAGLGEVQLWRRKSQTIDSSMRPRAPIRETRSDSHTDTGAGQINRHLSDNLSLFTDSSTGREFYLLDHVHQPLLVMFVKEESGAYTMLKTELPPLKSIVEDNSLILQPASNGAHVSFPVKQLTVGGAELDQWNVCAMGSIAKVPPLTSLTSTSLTVRPRAGDAQLIENGIFELKIEYSTAMLESSRARGATRRNQEPQAALARARKSSGSTESSSSSATATNFAGLPFRGSFESLAGMIHREMASARLSTVNGVMELDSRSPSSVSGA